MLQNRASRSAAWVAANLDVPGLLMQAFVAAP
jgi:hypothetical protein